jgi:hypothetical protein
MSVTAYSSGFLSSAGCVEEEMLTFRADAEKARRWILDAMNIVKET